MKTVVDVEIACGGSVIVMRKQIDLIFCPVGSEVWDAAFDEGNKRDLFLYENVRVKSSVLDLTNKIVRLTLPHIDDNGRGKEVVDVFKAHGWKRI